MKTNNESGRVFCIIIGVWLLLKSVLNIVINVVNGGGLAQDMSGLIISIVICVFLLLGIKYSNYVIAVYIALIVLIHLFDNLSGLFHGELVRLIYLLEGAADIGSAAALCMSGSIKEHFTNSFSDITGN